MKNESRELVLGDVESRSRLGCWILRRPVTFLLSLLVLAAAPALVAWQVAATASKPQVLRAQRLEIVDKQGRVRIELTVDDFDGGAPRMTLLDGKGNYRIIVQGGEAGSLWFKDAEDRTRAILGECGDGASLD